MQYIPGNINIIITVPHGGDLQPDDIPDRIYGCPVTEDCEFDHDESCSDEDKCSITTVKDTNTIHVGTVISETIEEELRAKPHLVIMNVKRYKTDICLVSFNFVREI